MSEERDDAGETRDHSEFTETVRLTPEEETARKRRNRWIFAGLMAFIVLIFLTTVVRLSQNIATSGGG